MGLKKKKYFVACKLWEIAKKSIKKKEEENMEKSPDSCVSLVEFVRNFCHHLRDKLLLLVPATNWWYLHLY